MKSGKKKDSAQEPEEGVQSESVDSGDTQETVQNAPTGREHWGEGGSFRIDETGRRVPVDEKE